MVLVRFGHSVIFFGRVNPRLWHPLRSPFDGLTILFLLSSATATQGGHCIHQRPGYYKDTEQVLGKTFGMCPPMRRGGCV